MRASDKIALVDKIGRELQSRFTFDDLIAFLREYKIEPPTEYTRNSKWLYTKHVLGGVPAEVILKIAEELAIDCPVGTSLAAGVPHNWKNTKGFGSLSAIFLYIKTKPLGYEIALRLTESAGLLLMRTFIRRGNGKTK